jgi:hypothetical protein
MMRQYPSTCSFEDINQWAEDAQARIRDLEAALRPFSEVLLKLRLNMPDDYDVLISDCLGKACAVPAGALRIAHDVMNRQVNSPERDT